MFTPDGRNTTKNVNNYFVLRYFTADAEAEAFWVQPLNPLRYKGHLHKYKYL
jgi:hypothetical protein